MTISVCSRTQLRNLHAALVLCATLAAPGALAATIGNPQATANGSNAEVDLCGPPQLFQYEPDGIAPDPVVTVDACGFTARFTQMLAVDVRFVGSTVQLQRLANHEVSFQVNADAGESWELQVSHVRRGDLRIQQDGGKCGWATLSGITMTPTGAAAFPNLNTPATYGICNCNDCNDDCPEVDSGDCTATQDQSATADVLDFAEGSITGTGPSAIALDFAWTGRVESQANLLGGGDEALVRLGLSTTNMMMCDDIIDAATYSTGSDGHEVTVRLISDDPAVVLDEEPTQCSGVVSQQPCTISASGTIEGCVGDNYTVFLTYFDANGVEICSTSVAVTDGDPHWYSEVVCPGLCRARDFELSVVNDPLAPFGGGAPDTIHGFVGEPVQCDGLLRAPAVGRRSLLVLALGMAAVGIGRVLLRVRTRARSSRE